MKRIVWSVVVLAIIVWAIFGNETKKENLEKSVVKIGLILPLTGDLSFYGESAKNGAMLAIDEVLEDNKFDYELIIEDSGNDIRKTSTIANKMITLDRVNAVFTLFAPPANVLKLLADKHQIIHIGAAWETGYTEGVYNFNNWNVIEDEIDVLTNKLKEDDLTNVAVFNVNQSGFNKAKEKMYESFKANGINVCNEVIFNFGRKDFRTDIYKAKECKPDIYILEAFTPELDVLAKQLKEIVGNDVKMTGLEMGINTPRLELFENSWYPSLAKTTDKFSNDYNDKYKQAPFFIAGNYYDNVNMVIHGFENSEVKEGDIPTNEEAARTIKAIDTLPSAYGEISIIADGVVRGPIDLYKISDGNVSVF